MRDDDDKFDSSNRFGFTFTSTTFERTGRVLKHEHTEETIEVQLHELLVNAIEMLEQSDFSVQAILKLLIEELEDLKKNE